MKSILTIHGSNKSDACAVSNCCIAVEIGISVPVVSYILSKVISVGEYVMRQQEYKKQNKVVLEGIEPVESREERLHMARQAFGRENMTYETAKRSEHPGRLLRLVTAGMLFSIAVCYCLQNGSVFGYDKEWIEQCLMDNHLWEQVSDAVAQGISQFTK